MEAFSFNGAMVYNAADLINVMPVYFKGCKTDIFKIIEKKCIPIESYFVAAFVKHVWIQLPNVSITRGRKLLICKDWIDKDLHKPVKSQSVISKSAHKILRKVEVLPQSCIYLFEIGTVYDVRSIFDIDDTISDTDIVFKYGKSNDLDRRFGEHTSTYKNMVFNLYICD